MLHKVGAEDNVSFYSNKHGKNDFILNLVWHKEFDASFQKHLSSVSNETPIAEGFNPSEDTDKKEITIDDCFDEFKKPEILDEDNMWYCSKCKEHV